MKYPTASSAQQMQERTAITESATPAHPTIFQFDLWLATLPKQPGSHVQSGLRPVIIVSSDAANSNSNLVSVIPLTTNLEHTQRPTHVLICNKDLRSHSRALVEQIITLDKYRLKHRIGRIEDPFEKLSIHHAIALQLGLTA